MDTKEDTTTLTMMKAFIREENMPERDRIDYLMKSFSDSINLSWQRHKEEITSQCENKIKIVEEKITEVHKLAEETAHTASNGYDIATQNKTIIDKKFKITSDHISNNDESINALRAEVYKLQSNLEDNINRGMRANLIFKGIPEDEAFSSYEETRKVLSNSIGSKLKLNHYKSP